MSSSTSPTKPLVLVIEDDPDMLSLIEETLELEERYAVLTARDGQQGLAIAQRTQPDLVIVDWMLPGLSGIEIIQRLRQTSRLPVVLLTSRAEVDDRVTGLDIGANDYITKPFEPAELLARVRSQLRSVKPQNRRSLEVGPLHMDLELHEVYCHGQLVHLTPTEYKLIHMFMAHPHQVLPRQRILEAIWGWDFEGEDNVLDVYMRALRTKLEACHPERLLQTVRGVGYALRLP